MAKGDDIQARLIQLAVEIVSDIQKLNTQATAPLLQTFDTVQVATFKNINQWTLVSGTLTQLLSKTRAGDSAYGSTLVYNGSASGKTYTNFIAFRDSIRTNGKYGSWFSFSSILHPEFWSETFSFSVDEKGNKVGAYSVFAGQQIIVADSSNGNGSLTVGAAYLPNPTIYKPALKAQWLSDGSGQWISYSTSGVQTDTGIWGK